MPTRGRAGSAPFARASGARADHWRGAEHAGIEILVAVVCRRRDNSGNFSNLGAGAPFSKSKHGALYPDNAGVTDAENVSFFFRKGGNFAMMLEGHNFPPAGSFRKVFTSKTRPTEPCDLSGGDLRPDVQRDAKGNADPAFTRVLRVTTASHLITIPGLALSVAAL